MTESNKPQIVRDYLSQLRLALAGVPDEVSRDIVEGISEELSGRDSASAAARIEELGDPMFIASEARAGVSDRPPAGQTRERSPQWYIVVTSLLVGFGGFVLPVVGWIAGLVMMWVSPSWRRWEKWVATMTAPVTALVVITVVLALRASTRLGSSSDASGGPLLDWWTIALAFLGVVPMLTAAWLLWRGLRNRQIRPEPR